MSNEPFVTVALHKIVAALFIPTYFSLLPTFLYAQTNEPQSTCYFGVCENTGQYSILLFRQQGNVSHELFRYEGETSNGQANGFGVGYYISAGIQNKFKQARVYYGGWKDNRPTGLGMYETANRRVFGDFSGPFETTGDAFIEEECFFFIRCVDGKGNSWNSKEYCTNDTWISKKKCTSATISMWMDSKKAALRAKKSQDSAIEFSLSECDSIGCEETYEELTFNVRIGNEQYRVEYRGQTSRGNASGYGFGNLTPLSTPTEKRYPFRYFGQWQKNQPAGYGLEERVSYGPRASSKDQSFYVLYETDYIQSVEISRERSGSCLLISKNDLSNKRSTDSGCIQTAEAAHFSFDVANIASKRLEN
ncbi:MAG: hypothetical protein AAF720_01440 [Pseudomonadota bacterium]